MFANIILVCMAMGLKFPSFLFSFSYQGMRNDNNGAYKVPGFGEKFIGVENQGVLQIHGKRKLSWTKIEGTVSPPSYYLNARVR